MYIMGMSARVHENKPAKMVKIDHPWNWITRKFPAIWYADSVDNFLEVPVVVVDVDISLP